MIYKNKNVEFQPNKMCGEDAFTWTIVTCSTIASGLASYPWGEQNETK